MKQVIPAGQFKAECLNIMEQVKRTGKEIVITKHRVPIAKLCPIEITNATLFGTMQGTIQINKDFLQPINEKWDADS